jgi:hypothetical protein
LRQLAAYLKEREGFDSIINDMGFASYRISGDECYIRDIFVYPDFRKSNVASEIADEIARIAIISGCKYISGSVSTLANGATDSTKVLLAYGFKIHSAIEGGILFRKDL